MNAWFPVSACGPACLDTPVARVGHARRARRWTDVTRCLANGAVPRSGPSRGAAVAGRALQAIGVTVDVIPPAVPWPTPRAGAGRLVVANHVSWVDDVALLGVMPGVRAVAKAELATWPLVGGFAQRSGTVFLDRARLRRLPGTVAEVADLLREGRSVLVHPEGTTSCGAELGRFRSAFFQAALDASAPVCPVALRYRIQDGPGTTVAGYFGGDSLRSSLSRVVAAQGLVLEVHLLPALEPTGNRRELAALAEYAIAGVTEAGAPVGTPHPDPVRAARTTDTLRGDHAAGRGPRTTLVA